MLKEVAVINKEEIMVEGYKVVLVLKLEVVMVKDWNKSM